MKIADFEVKGISVVNDMGERRITKKGSIVFPNGWCANIIYASDGWAKQEKKYSVAVCDYNGYFDWSILLPFGANENGTFETDDENEVCKMLAVIEAF